jgi:chaperone LolA
LGKKSKSFLQLLYHLVSVVALLSAFFALYAYAKDLPTKKLTPEVEVLQKVLSKYKNSKFTSATVERKLTQSLQGKTSVSQGQVFLSGSLFRLELKGKEETTIVFDGKKIWTETKNESEKQPQVTSMRVGGKAQNQLLLNEVFVQGKLLERFNVLSATRSGDSILFDLEPNKNVASVSSLKVSIDAKNTVLEEFTYFDELENETSYKFSEQKFDQKMSSKKFKYTPPKGVLVTEL